MKPFEIDVQNGATEVKINFMRFVEISKLRKNFSEESECRAGLIQERISCVNLLNYACQFVDKSYVFRLVPARITIQVSFEISK